MFNSVDLREVMRRWPCGVAILTTGDFHQQHGMTVNSFTSVSVDPPMITVTINKASRTKKLLDQTGFFAINLLAEGREGISERFAGRTANQENRFAGLELFFSERGTPMLCTSAAGLDCKTVHQYEMSHSILYVADVLQSLKGKNLPPLVYFNRHYHRITE